jgi:hypothetical protein
VLTSDPSLRQPDQPEDIFNSVFDAERASVEFSDEAQVLTSRQFL